VSTETSYSYKVLVGIASRGNDINAHLLNLLLREKKPVITAICNFSPNRAQNDLLRFAHHLNAEYLVCIDSDVIPPYGAIDKLVSHGLDIVSAPVWHHANGVVSLNYELKENEHAYSYPEKLTEVLFTSFGMICIHRRVLDKFKDLNDKPLDWSNLIDKSFENLSPDHIFSEKVRKMGFKIWIDPEIRGVVHNCTVRLEDDTIKGILENVKI
jgi:hypothetical protein